MLIFLHIYIFLQIIYRYRALLDMLNSINLLKLEEVFNVWKKSFCSEYLKIVCLNVYNEGGFQKRW